jgi:hypothetical protein
MAAEVQIESQIHPGRNYLSYKDKEKREVVLNALKKAGLPDHVVCSLDAEQMNRFTIKIKFRQAERVSVSQT